MVTQAWPINSDLSANDGCWREAVVRLSLGALTTTFVRSEPGLEQKALSSGATCFLDKPLETEPLLHCLKRALRA